jgi:hypothetical protein
MISEASDRASLLHQALIEYNMNSAAVKKYLAGKFQLCLASVER